MKNTKKVMMTILFFTAVVSLVVAVNAGNVAQNDPSTGRDYYAVISYQIFEGEGCECIPIIDVPITAFSRDSDHNDSNVTNDEGYLELQLHYDQVYRVSIQAEGFESVLYDFLVIDNQPFIFNLKKSEEVSAMTGLQFFQILWERFHPFQR